MACSSPARIPGRALWPRLQAALCGPWARVTVQTPPAHRTPPRPRLSPLGLSLTPAAAATRSLSSAVSGRQTARGPKDPHHTASMAHSFPLSAPIPSLPFFFFFKLPRAFRELCVFEFRGGGCTLTRLPSCRVRKS